MIYRVMYVYIYIYTYSYTYIYIYIYLYMYICVYSYIYIYTYVYVYVCTYIIDRQIDTYDIAAVCLFYLICSNPFNNLMKMAFEPSITALQMLLLQS